MTLILMTVALILSVLTPLVDSPVPVTKATLEMDLPVKVRIYFDTKLYQSISNSDIDECAISSDNCDSNAVCTNTAGSFTCACNQGYTGDGLTCLGNNSF